MGADTTILFVEVIVGVGVLVLVAAAASCNRRPEGVCEQCGAENALDVTQCRVCGEVMSTQREPAE